VLGTAPSRLPAGACKVPAPVDPPRCGPGPNLLLIGPGATRHHHSAISSSAAIAHARLGEACGSLSDPPWHGHGDSPSRLRWSSATSRPLHLRGNGAQCPAWGPLLEWPAGPLERRDREQNCAAAGLRCRP